jgi:diguanylate cyclase (GGDEF)-like protein
MPPWQTRKRTLRYAAFGLALALLAAVGVATIWSVERTAASYDWIQHTYRVIATVQEYRASLRGAEAAARLRLTGHVVSELSVLMLDVDHFKAFNDTHGHAAGDAMLAAIGHSLQAATRSEDLACRYGGEEFTVVLVEAAPEDALRRAEQIRASIAATTVQHLKRTLGPCTASIGLAMLPSDGLTPTELLEAADQALYRAKSEGRDRVVAAARPALSELSSSTSRA